jgi:hypothetical protein
MSKEIFELEILVRLNDQASRGMKSLFTEIRAGDSTLKRQAGLWRDFDRARRAYDGGRMVVDIWKREIESLSKYTDAAMKVQAVQQRLFTLNLSPKENEHALAGINDVVKNLRGMQIDEVTESFLDLHSALGSVEHALDFLPTASKYRFNMKSLFGEKFSKEEIESQILGAFKFMEQTGVMRATGGKDAQGRRMFTEEDKRRAEEYFDVISKITAGTAGRITGSTLLPLAGRGGISMMGMSPKGLMNLGFLINEMGGPQTGTALMSLWSKMTGGQMTNAALQNLIRVVGRENIDTNKIKFNKHHPGIPEKAEAGFFKQAHLLQEDPGAFADFMAGALKKNKGLDPDKMGAKEFEQKATEAIFAITRQRTAANMLAKMIVMRDHIRKDFDIFSQAKGVDPQYAQSLDSITGRINELKATRENFHAAVGNNLLGIEGSLLASYTPALKAMSDFFMQHPEAAKMAGILLLTGKGVSGLAQTLIALRFAGLIGGLGEASTAAEAARGRVGILNGALRGLPASIQIAIAIPLIAWTVTKVVELVTELKNLQEARDNLINASKGGEQSYDRLKEEFGNQGKQLPPQIVKSEATGSFASLNEGQILDKWLGKVKGDNDSWIANWFNNFIPGSNAQYPYNPHRIEDTDKAFHERAGSLKNPEVMREFIRMMTERYSDKDKLGQVLGRAQHAWPDSFKDAQQQILRENLTHAAAMVGTFADTGDKGVKSFDSASKSAGDMATELKRAALAATSFAERAGLTEPKNPGSGKGGVKVSTNAVGGHVESSGIAIIHAGESIVPARVKQPYREQGANRGGEVHHHHGDVHVHVHPVKGSPASENPRELAKLVAHEVRRQRERR